MTTRNTGVRGLLDRLSRLNRTTVFLVTLGVMLAALFLPGILGALLLLVLAGAAGWLLTHTWAVLPTSARVLRLAVIGLLVLAAINKL